MRKLLGFTLIELMIVVAIIAIITMIAYPSYQNSIAKGRRADAQAALQGLAQAMERHMTANGSYAGAGTTNNADGIPTTGAPTIFSAKSPIDGSETFYNLTIDSADATSYTLLATPVNGQAGDGVLGLESTGRRGWDRNGDNDPFDTGETCWDHTCN